MVLLAGGLVQLEPRTGSFHLAAPIPSSAEPNGLARLPDGWAVPTETKGLLLVRNGRQLEWIGPAEGLPAATVSARPQLRVPPVFAFQVRLFSLALSQWHQSPSLPLAGRRFRPEIRFAAAPFLRSKGRLRRAAAPERPL